jgi:hypothetical protein
MNCSSNGASAAGFKAPVINCVYQAADGTLSLQRKAPILPSAVAKVKKEI